MRRFFSCLMSLVLVVGILPAPAFAEVSAVGPAGAIERAALVGDAPAANPGKADPSLAVSGKAAWDIVRDMKIGWNLGNTLESHTGEDEPQRTDIDYERIWGNPRTTAEMIAFLKEQGFNAVRVPVTWYQHIHDDGRDASDPTSVYHIDDAWLARVHEVVDYCYEQGMYVTLNTHHEKGWLESPAFGDAGEHREAMKTELSAIWKQLAKEFADYDQRLVFESLNEPRATGEGIEHAREWGSPTAGDIESLNQLNQAFVDTVRSVESPYRTTRLLLCPTSSASTKLPMIAQIEVPQTGGATDPYVGIAAHPYEPWWFTAQTDQYADHTWSAKNQVALEQVLYRMYATFTSKGVPVVLDEFNAQDFDNSEDRAKWAKRYIELARGYGMTCFLWDNGGTEANVNAAGNRTAYLDRYAAHPKWVNAKQQAQVEALMQAVAESEWKSAFGKVEVPTAASACGHQLNGDAFTAEKTVAAEYDVRWSLIERGGVAIEFEGAVVPSLVATNKAGGGWTYLSGSDITPSYVAWNKGANGGVAYFWPDHIEKLWLAGSDNGTANALDDLRLLKVGTTGASTKVVRVLLPGVETPDVSGGSYGAGVSRKLVYTRPVTLEHSSASAENPKAQTVLIDTEAPDMQGADIAVRFTGTTPHLAFIYYWEARADDANRSVSASGWEGWVSVKPWLVADAGDDTGQRVAFFSRADIDATWKAKEGEWWDASADDATKEKRLPVKGLNNGNTPYNNMLVRVSNGICNLVEVAALDVDEPEAPAMRPESERMSGREIIDDMGAGYNFGGQLECYLHSKVDGVDTISFNEQDGGWLRSDLAEEVSWGNGYLTEGMFKVVKERGFKTVRIPVSWGQHIYPQGDPTCRPSESDEADPLKRYHIDEAWLERVHQVVDFALRNDLYVILNTHHEGWIDRIDMDTPKARAEMVEELEAVWTQIAAEFEGYDQRLVFEGVNEPHATGAAGDREWNKPNAGDIATVNALNDAFVKLIHGMSAHKDRLCLCSTYGGHPELTHIADYAFPDDGSGLVAVSTHPYTPYSYTSDKAVSGCVFTGAHQAELERVMEGVRSTFTSKGIPVVFDEFGCYYHEDAAGNDGRLAWLASYVTAAKELGIPCVAWPLEESGGVRFFDRVSCTWPEESKSYIDAWFDILADDDIAWGSRASIAEGEHGAIEHGEQLLDGEKTIEQIAGDSTSFRVSFNVSWDGKEVDEGTWSRATSALEGRELAVRFEGTTPRLSLLSDWSGNWNGIEPSAIDAEKGIAYFSARSVRLVWTDEHDLADLNRVAVRTSGKTTLKAVAIVEPDAHLHDWSAWEVVGSCAEPGTMSRTCLLDPAHAEEREIAALGHDWADGYARDKAPTYSAAGSESIHCARCGAVKPGSERPVAKLAQTSLSGAKIVLKRNGVAVKGNAVTFNGKVQKPTVAVTSGKETLKEGSHYTLSFLRGSSKTGDFKNAGKITVKATAISGGKFKGSKTVTFTIAKASQSITAQKSVAKSYTGKKAGKKRVLAATKTFSLKSLAKVSARTTVAYAKANAKGGKLITVSKKGVVTVKKGLVKGLYAVKVKLTAPAGTNYTPAPAKTITVNVRVK